MKKSLLFLPVGLLAMVGCSDRDPGNLQNDGAVSVFNQYVSVNILSANGIGSRADYNPSAKDYENGSAEENQVNRVRFYFFDASGNATPVWENKGAATTSFNSFIDWYPTSADAEEVENVPTIEKILHATLGLNYPSGITQPSSLIAILNPSDAALNLSANNSSVDAGDEMVSVYGPSIDQVRECISDFYNGLDTDGNFVMSNSVYMQNQNGVNTVIDYTGLTSDNFLENPEQAIEDPTKIVTIYVERVLARLDFYVNLGNGEDNTLNEPLKLEDGRTIYKLDTYTINDGSIIKDVVTPTDETLYVELLGWNITGTPDVSRLLKSINTSWTNLGLFGSDAIVWNTADYHRSFWALNPPSDDLTYQFGDFGFNPNDDDTDSSQPDNTFRRLSSTLSDENLYPANALIIPSGTDYTTAYLQENANEFNNSGVNANAGASASGPEYATKVIIAARLVDATGNPYELAEWAHYKYTKSQLLTTLCSTTLNQLYKKTTSGTTTSYDQIEEDDLTFMTASQLGIEDGEADYYVYVVLADSDPKDYTWTLGKEQNATEMTVAQVNNYIRDAVNHVKVWNSGMTYYFFDIQHLGNEDTPGYYGVVRNHIYKSYLKSITGMGTPVYDPDQIIYPEKTENDNDIVVAQIEILQWRVVSQDYNLDWGEGGSSSGGNSGGGTEPAPEE